MLRLVSDVALFVPLFDALAQIGLAKAQKSFRTLGWSWAPNESLTSRPFQVKILRIPEPTSGGSAVKEPVGHFTHFTCDIGRSRHVTTYSQPIRNSVHLNIVERIWTDKAW